MIFVSPKKLEALRQTVYTKIHLLLTPLSLNRVLMKFKCGGDIWL